MKDFVVGILPDDNPISEIMKSGYNYGFDTGYRAGVESAQPKWISVEERLPEDGKIVLGAFLRYDGYEINITKYCVYPNRNVWFIGDMNAVGSTPTHWMPLPELPEEVQEC